MPEFIDEGYGGSMLIRPALERLQDVAAAGSFDRLYIHCPDRFARNYAYQVLLKDEIHQQGAEVIFLNRPLGQTVPHRRDVTLRENASQVRNAGVPQALAALNGGILVLMDWLQVRNVASQMRHYYACPMKNFYCLESYYGLTGKTKSPANTLNDLDMLHCFLYTVTGQHYYSLLPNAQPSWKAVAFVLRPRNSFYTKNWSIFSYVTNNSKALCASSGQHGRQ